MKITNPASGATRSGAIKRHFLKGTCAAALMLASSLPAAAQDEAGLEEIVITGSRIARQDYVSNSPLTTVGAEAFEQSGALTPENLLNQLPQVVPDLSTTSNNPSSNGGPGQANINLRGLGANRNLVLINGRRMIGSNEFMLVDVNNIPTALIERVEVISGGASAVYGADAVAGVVNFILKDDFEGIRADGQYGVSEKGDGEEYSGDLTLGGNFAEGRGNATLNFSYAERRPIYKGARAFAAQADTLTGFLPWGSVVPSGTNLPTQAAVDAVFARYNVPAGGVVRTDRLGFNSDNTLFSISHSDAAPPVANFRDPIDSRVATAFFPGRLSYNFEPDNILTLPLERTSVAGTANYEVTEWAEAYFQAIYTNYNATQQLAPSPAPTGSRGFFFAPVTNPYVPADLRQILASRPNPDAPIQLLQRFTQGGGRVSTNYNNVHQFLGGLRGSLPNDWRWDVYAATGRVDSTEIQTGNVSYSAVQELLTAPDGGASICGVFNPFGFGRSDQECIDYIGVTAKNQRTIEQEVVEGSLSGNVFPLPAGDVGFAVGAQYRHERFDFEPDQVLASGDVSGFSAQNPLEGDITNKDVFGELFVPILRDVPFAQSVSVTGGFRYSDHSTADTFNSYKVEGDWSIIEQLRLRGSYQRAVRAPSIGELFAPQDEDNPEVVDPCNVNSPQRTGGSAAQVRALCLTQGISQGIIDAYEQPNGQLDALNGGNPDLQEETADTFTIGTVISSPSDNPLFSRMSMSVDYYHIKITDVINAIGADVSVPRCFNEQGANPNFDPNNFFCRLFTRRALDGAIIGVQQTQQNLSTLKVSGIDAQLDWGFDLPNEMGDLNLSVVLSWLDQFNEQILPGDPFNNFAGSISGTTDVGETYPEWKSTFTATWSLQPVQLTLRALYIDAMKNSNLVTDPTDTTSTGVPSTWYFDLSGRYDVTENFSVRAGVLNALDQGPRLYAPNVQARTDPSVYDVIGRRFFVGATVKF